MRRIEFVRRLIWRKRKLTIVLIGAIILLSVAATESQAKMFGKSFDSSHDYSCCVGQSLYVFHYYTSQVFWITVNSGYGSELIGTGSCQFQCPPPNEMD